MSSDKDGDASGHRSVRRSRAGPGVVADPPTDGGAITVVEVTNPDDEPTGLLIEWKCASNSQWIWAKAGSYREIPR
ncbi:hypothetical protein M193_gp005 [Halorubrum tailed phage 7]|uniref:Uncharacterized protein n=1 Tax=Halorubrum sodomense tailed virus 2 TaxID=1262527 RepID=L7TGJ1_9CAUD|nr:hypothetical protein HSTV2_5 [Halorubrum sodomense tailed virus 2]YP_008059989.1 hypothetical protein M193_gp005 [Halorubrum tailed phage 7]UBF22153.1 hypothetical protein HRTV-2_gp5 [Halorubrum virus HRTV-2]UBF22262.1 hypothetical protein HRTV-11_gp5 [Halorubrum virus HRTV-11]UBF22372.1 hypothetical protein HCTV-6_gp5 [Haloarcula virus HCTV-6]UBF22479.1 hypothetical protein HCTV-15_gp5 [Haloarcula virus HCTV-15]AGC34274.1 hypothetical protein HSTV2_5 [Halorubrum sodomense tailed virus 2]